jgi:hypothetical protein
MSAKLFELLEKASQDDLDVIDKQIDQKVAAMDEIKQEVDKLKTLRKTISLMVNGRPERKKVERKPKGARGGASPDVASSAEDRRKRIALYLSEHGATRPQELAIQLKEDMPNVMYSITNGYFTKTERGVVLTTEGRNKYLES